MLDKFIIRYTEQNNIVLCKKNRKRGSTMAFVSVPYGLTSDTTGLSLYQEKVESSPDTNDEQLPEDSYTIDYAEMIADSAYICTYPIHAILDGIKEHFDDYINIEDDINYVDIFYDQWHYSREVALSDEKEMHRNDILEALENIHQNFLEHIKELFKTRLTITITDLEDDVPDDPEDIEYIIRTIYDYFIIDARKNFKNVITTDIVNKLSAKDTITDDNLFFDTVSGMLNFYSPLVRVLTPEQFMRYSASHTREDVIAMYEDGRLSGNFLRKYTCKLYKNEDFKVEIMNDVVIKQDFNNDILSGSNDQNEGGTVNG